jgi:HD superfamily phosphohydrolase
MSEIRDSIFGFIEPKKDEWKILDSPLLQRLRRIRQLALAYLVYPGALHTRFEHSLGVFHLAAKMADKLLSNADEEDNKQIVRWAALLHDVGHGPFSHVSESILEMFFENSDNTGEKTEKIHEKITSLLLKQNEELRRILGEDKIDEVIGVLSGELVDISLMKQIVSGPIDADKQDYLLRDSRYCGVKYGVYDYLRLINTLGRYEEDGDEYICVEWDGLHALEQFILAKYYMTQQVYRHRIRLITDEMIKRGIELGITHDKIKELRALYEFKSSPGYLENYLKWWDDRLFNFLVFGRDKGYAHDIFKRLYYRDLFKEVFRVKLKEEEDIQGTERLLLQKITKRENHSIRKRFEAEIARVLGKDIKPEYTIINSYQVKSVKEVSRDGEEEGRLTIRNEKERKIFEEASTVFRSIDDSLNEVWVEVYAPVEFKEKREKDIMKKKWKKEIIEILKQGENV